MLERTWPGTQVEEVMADDRYVIGKTRLNVFKGAPWAIRRESVRLVMQEGK